MASVGRYFTRLLARLKTLSWSICFLGGAYCYYKRWELLRDSKVDNRLIYRSRSGNSYLDRILSRCPSVKYPKYIPTPWATNRWINAFVFLFKQRWSKWFNPFPMKRELVTHPDGGTTALDWGDDDHSKALPKDAPILVLFHTITGSSEGTSYYYRAALKKGFRTVVFTRRGHGDLKLQTPKFNIMGDTSDAIAMMECVQKSYPECKWIGLVGISAGSGLMVSYLGQCGDNTPVKAGCSLCPAYDIEGALSNLKLKYPASDKYILNCAKSLWFGNAEKKARMRSFDEDATEKCLKATTLLDFVHCHYRFAGHATLSEYWKWHNPMSHYTGVKRPVLILNSDDDLVCVKENIREDLASEELNSLLIRTKYGSHVAYSEGWFGESNYMVRLSLDFMEACFVEDTTAGPELC